VTGMVEIILIWAIICAIAAALIMRSHRGGR